MLCIDWQESSNGEGGWLVTGCNNGTVGVSWVEKKGTVEAKRSKESDQISTEQDCRARDGDMSSSEDNERSKEVEGRERREDNLACTKEACLYKSHFILKSHTGEVS